PAPLLRGALQTLQRLDNLGAASFGFLALLALAFDHFFRRAPDKIGVAELRVDAGDVARNLGHLLLKPATLRTEIDHALERQCREFPPDHELDCICRGCIREADLRDAGEPLDEGIPSLGPGPTLPSACDEPQ